MKYTLPFAASLALIAAIAVLWAPSVPLGVPGEWVWNRHAAPAILIDALDRFLLPVLVAVATFIVAWKGREKIETTSAGGLMLRYGLLIAVSLVWYVQLQQTTPLTHRTLKPLWVLYDRSSSGYFFEAAYEIDSTPDFLATYEDRMREGEVLHVGTHPPGLFLLSRRCIDVCEASPLVEAAVSSTLNVEAQRAFRLVESELQVTRPLTHTELCGLQLLAHITTLAAVLAIIPIGIVVALMLGRTTAWETATLWATLPCVAVFFPKSDVLFPLTATSVLALWVLSLRPGRISLVFAGAAGIVLWAGAMMSLAHIPVVVVIGMLSTLRGWKNVDNRKPDVLRLAVFGSSFLVVTAVWSLSNDCNLFNVWRLNLQNHEGFYGQFTRTMWKWTVVNPIELTLAVGPLLFVAAVAGTMMSVRKLNSVVAEEKCELSSKIVVAAMATFTLLWLSGKNQGEAARLWCFLTPWLLFAAAIWLSKRSTQKPWRLLLASQLIYALAAVSRVNGFSI